MKGLFDNMANEVRLLRERDEISMQEAKARVEISRLEDYINHLDLESEDIRVVLLYLLEKIKHLMVGR